MFRFAAVWLLRSSVVLVVFIAIILQRPHRELDWEGTIVPLARQYAANEDAALPLQGTTIVITGATSGIGWSLTKTLTKLGGSVVALGRSKSKLEELQRELPSIQTVVVDLADLDDVSRAANDLRATLPHIDILINNAGMHGLNDMFAQHATVGEDPPYDRVFVVNYLAHFLLTDKLWPLLSKSSKKYAIVAQTTSSFHWAVDGSDLQSSDANDAGVSTLENERIPIAARPGGSTGFYVYRTQRSYANSKLAQIYHARSLSSARPQEQDQEPAPTRIRTVSICPGWVATNIGGAGGARILERIAFPKDGWGIASSLMALFDNATATENDLPTNDYYINSNVFRLTEILFSRPTPWWMYQFGIRDVILDALSKVALVAQNLFPYAGPVKSSPESYNITIANSLYDWSKAAITKYA
jgi:NAD(P)-dependent dehydrogenase (short-subunit alcohol dehydrogenase family)